MTTKATIRRSFTDEFKHEAVSLLASLPNCGDGLSPW